MKVQIILCISISLLSFFISANELKLEKLDSISQILMDNLDQKHHNCGLNEGASKNVLNALHAKLDENSKKYLKTFNFEKASNWPQICSAGCHCEFYMGIIENNLDDSKFKSLYEKLQSKTISINKKQKNTCLKKAKKLCNSKIMKSLIKDSKNFASAAGR